MNLFYDLEEMMKRMDEKHSSARKSTPASKRTAKPEPQLSYEESQKQKQRDERKSCIILVAGAIGVIVLLFVFIQLYFVIGDYVFNSSLFKVIAILGFIGITLYMLFLLGGLIYSSFAQAKSSGGRSVLALILFFLLSAAVFTIMNRCT